MKTNEVRAGNRILFAEDGTEFIVTDIVGSGFNVKNEEENTWIEADQFEGIPLTEEWFLKFGFEIKERKSFHGTPIYFVSDADSDICFSWAEFRLDYGMYVEYTDSPFDRDFEYLYPITFGIKYVHQLQNIIFVLFGSELTIKE